MDTTLKVTSNTEHETLHVLSPTILAFFSFDLIYFWLKEAI